MGAISNNRNKDACSLQKIKKNLPVGFTVGILEGFCVGFVVGISGFAEAEVLEKVL